VFCFFAVAALSYGANFTYDGINRRDPLNELERNTISATGRVYCTESKTGRRLVTTGFLIDIGQERKNSILIASGHSFEIQVMMNTILIAYSGPMALIR